VIYSERDVSNRNQNLQEEHILVSDFDLFFQNKHIRTTGLNVRGVKLLSVAIFR